MKLTFKPLTAPENIDTKLWNNWKWQLKQAQSPFKHRGQKSFPAGATPYYIRLLNRHPCLKGIIEPSEKELAPASGQMKDPLGEKDHSPLPHLIHRYPDRILFLVTDICGVYCRYCTRKHYTGQKKAFISKNNREKALSYIKRSPGIREVILSGGDPLSLSDSLLEKLLKDIRSIEHIEIIRIASRLPVVCPMRLTAPLIKILRACQPVFLMTHFNHPLELTGEAQEALSRVAEAGILMFNQTVLLNKINNHPALIQALMRRLLYLRVKPYYMFQCDPSKGSDHFRTSIENSQRIQKALWGRLSGLALPNLSVDIPGGGGKVGLVPDFSRGKEGRRWHFKGWDNLEGTYIRPSKEEEGFSNPLTEDLKEYEREWDILKNQSYGKWDKS